MDGLSTESDSREARETHIREDTSNFVAIGPVFYEEDTERDVFIKASSTPTTKGRPMVYNQFEQTVEMLKVTAAGFAATVSAVLATPSGSELSTQGIAQILAERYPFILLSIVFVVLLLRFLKENAVSTTKREELIFEQFKEIRKEDREAVSKSQEAYFQQLQAATANAQVSQERILLALERLQQAQLDETKERQALKSAVDAMQIKLLALESKKP